MNQSDEQTSSETETKNLKKNKQRVLVLAETRFKGTGVNKRSKVVITPQEGRSLANYITCFPVVDTNYRILAQTINK